MAKAVLISIRPKWCEKIVGGEKTIEVRKTRPKLETPFKVYIYCTSGRPDLNIPISPERLMQDYLDTGSMRSLNCPLGNGKVIGEFVCDRVKCIMEEQFVVKEDAEKALEGSLMTINQAKNYAKWKHGTPHYECKDLYGWHISNLKIYDAPKDLNEFWLPPELYCEKERCGGCPYDQVSDVNGEYSFDCEWKRPLTRPPQSWCYVEELK